MRRRLRTRGRRRTVSWIDGFTGFDITGASGLYSKTIALTVVDASVPLILGSATVLTAAADLYASGGEDAVMTRIRGGLAATTGRIDSGAGNLASSFPIRVVIARSSITSDGLRVMPSDFITSAGLGRDDILWSRDIAVTAQTGIDPITFGGNIFFEVDVKAQRKLQRDAQIILWFMTVKPAAWVASDFQIRGGLRMLLKRPR